VPAIAEHGRGLKIINAVADNLQLTRNEREGTTVRFEDTGMAARSGWAAPVPPRCRDPVNPD
jgi:hypothetical protein